MSESGFFEVDTDELRTQGASVVRLGDEVEAAGRRALMAACDQYGTDGLRAAADRFGSRFQYLVQGLGAEVADMGVDMRASAYHIEEMEALTADGFNQIMPY